MKKEIAITKIAIFRKQEIRKTIHKNEWWFVIVDVVAALTDSVQPSGYIKDIRRRDPELSKGWGQIAIPFAVKTSGGAQKLNCANTEGIFRCRIKTNNRLNRVYKILSQTTGKTCHI